MEFDKWLIRFFKAPKEEIVYRKKMNSDRRFYTRGELYKKWDRAFNPKKEIEG